MAVLLLKQAVVALGFSSIVIAAPQPYCKPTPGSAEWPAASEWQSLNDSISGRLIAPVPPGLVCQPTSASFNNETCQTLVEQWGNSTFQAGSPFTSDYNDDTCLPDARAPCSAAGYPAYVVNATNASHVQAGVAFAHKTGVRLIVKGTGHDFIGRSAGRDAISIYTHNIRGIEVTPGDKRAQKYGGIASVKIAAGTQMRELYSIVTQNNLTVVGGADLNVGIGGWVTGAGHSPLSSKFGLGADQVLEMEIVTANGTFLTINEDSYPDLFWAMRGGGGSTFAVMISVTMNAFPSIPFSSYTFSYNTTANSETFWDLATFLHTQLADLSDNGVMGYYFMTPDQGEAQPDPELRGILYGLWILPEKTAEQANATLTPFEQGLMNNASTWADAIHSSVSIDEYPDFTSVWQLMQPQSVGIDLRLGSRLLGRKALATDPKILKEALKKTTTNPKLSFLGHLVAGDGVKNAKIPGGSNSVLPAWRDAITHIVLPRSWPYLNETLKEAFTTQLRDVEVEALRQLAPDSGAYINEADPTEPNWRETFWGANYPRLLQIKDFWDPNGVFWCLPCVGHGRWTVTSDQGSEAALGQNSGKICRIA